jgi:hypothetical protein
VFVGFSCIFLMGILILKGVTAQRLYKSFGVKGLILIVLNILSYLVNHLFNLIKSYKFILLMDIKFQSLYYKKRHQSVYIIISTVALLQTKDHSKLFLQQSL